MPPDQPFFEPILFLKRNQLAAGFVTEALNTINPINLTIHPNRRLDVAEHIRRCVSMQQLSTPRFSCKCAAN
jgi:hypothetical protein